MLYLLFNNYNKKKTYKKTNFRFQKIFFNPIQYRRKVLGKIKKKFISFWNKQIKQNKENFEKFLGNLFIYN